MAPFFKWDKQGSSQISKFYVNFTDFFVGFSAVTPSNLVLFEKRRQIMNPCAKIQLFYLKLPYLSPFFEKNYGFTRKGLVKFFFRFHVVNTHNLNYLRVCIISLDHFLFCKSCLSLSVFQVIMYIECYGSLSTQQYIQ